MLNIFRAQISRATAPMAQGLARAGVNPDALTLVGTVGAVTGALVFFTRGWFFIGTLVVWFFVMADLVDGAVARARGHTTTFGAMLDSVSDRVADAAVFGALAWWFSGRGNSRALELASLLCLVLGALTSYVKARAEGLGMTCNVGVAERAERLIIALVGTGLDGLGVPYVQAAALWLLVGLSTITVGQRMLVVWRQSTGRAVPTRKTPGPTRKTPGPTGDAAGPTGDAAGPTRKAPGAAPDVAPDGT